MKKILTITQKERVLEADDYYIGYVSSGNNIAELIFADDYFKGYIIGVTCAVDEKTIIDLEYNSQDNTIKLPYVIFKECGYKYIALYGIKGEETITTALLEIYVNNSNTLITTNEPEAPSWKVLATALWDDYYKSYVEPVSEKIDRLAEETENNKDELIAALSATNEAVKNAANATTNANEAVKRANTATTNAQNATTSAQNATVSANSAANSVVIIRNGTTTPASSLGKSGDFYVNTINGDFYLKSGSSWSKKFNMIALDQITELKNAFNSVTSLTKQMFLLMHPIGCIYMSTSSVSPQTTFGGTWIRWGNGRVPVGVDTSDNDFNYVEKTGGEKEHTLTLEELPTFQPKVTNAWTGSTSGGSNSKIAGYPSSGTGQYQLQCDAIGGDQPHNNLQPYITCYMWKRTA